MSGTAGAAPAAATAAAASDTTGDGATGGGAAGAACGADRADSASSGGGVRGGGAAARGALRTRPGGVGAEGAYAAAAKRAAKRAANDTAELRAEVERNFELTTGRFDRLEAQLMKLGRIGGGAEDNTELFANAAESFDVAAGYYYLVDKIRSGEDTPGLMTSLEEEAGLVI